MSTTDNATTVSGINPYGYCWHRLPCGYCQIMSKPCPMQGNTNCAQPEWKLPDIICQTEIQHVGYDEAQCGREK